ncbi:MAG: type II toxin-antitoxin system VapC family toxin [Bacteroidetes bacterium]|nr:type II toxin-antitoxin system VapC family toxin [Bacteroidota bacterium]
MNYLLDTHTLIWFLNGDKNLSTKARKAIESTEAINFVSIASLWEIAIKISLERLELKMPLQALSEQILNNSFQILPITFEDILILSKLKFHHRDPFDRILISQAVNNSFTLISKDKQFDSYKVKLLW